MRAQAGEGICPRSDRHEVAMPGLELKAPSPKAQTLTYNATLYFLVNAQSGKHLLRSCFVPSTLPGLRGQILPQDAERWALAASV